MNVIRINLPFAELQRREERWNMVMKFQTPDRIPVLHYIGSRYWLPVVGYSDDFSAYFNDPRVMLEAQLQGQKWILENIRSDFHKIVVYPDFMWVEDISAFGAEIKFPKNDSPWVARPHYFEHDENLDRIRQVDFVHTGLHGKMIDFYHKMKELSGEYEVAFSDGKTVSVRDFVVPGGAGVIGLAALAGDLCGVENFSFALYDKPDWVKELLDVITEKAMAWITAVLKLDGGNMGFAGDYYENIIHIGDDGTPQMSPDQFEEFMVPVFLKLASHIKKSGCQVQAHNCGRADHLLRYWAEEIQIDRYLGFSYQTDKNLLKEIMGGRILLLGGLDTVKIHDGSPAEVIEDCKLNLEIFKNCTGYVAMDGHNIAPGSPVENINAVMTAVEKYGMFS